MSDVLINLTVHARGQMATALLAAADDLGLSPYVVKTTSEGFRVPVEIHRHLFPSQYADLVADAENAPVGDPEGEDFGPADDTRYDELDFAELREEAKRRDLSAGGSADEIRARLREDDDTNPAEL